jgi:C4-dicarboxylate-specific signal transduction histidine kinase
MPPNFVTTLPHLIYFIVVALLISWFSSSRRRAERLLNQARSELELRIEERTADLSQANQQLRDEIVERHQAEHSLRQAQSDLAHVSRVTTVGELVASIAHEVNQPLGAIVTNGQACIRLLSSETPDTERSRQVIGRMINDGLRASEVIKRIRDLLHKAETEKVRVNINEIIEEVIELVDSDLRRSEVELGTELAEDLRLVAGDRIQLQQVILNLILNARDAMNELPVGSRALLISSRQNGLDEVVVSVRDSGKGLDTKDAARIFDPFFTTKPDGMGLGLSISRRIIEEHGGVLSAIANEDKGATIQFTLPASSESE